MRQDIMKILQLKSKHVRLIKNDFDRFTKLCSTQCNFLFTNYTDIFNRILKDELDLNILGSVIDVLGNEVISESFDSRNGVVSEELNFENMESGVYFVNLLVDNERLIKKVIVE